jgi:hypothetical protein
MAGTSRALIQFNEGLKMAEELLKLEREYHNPPRQSEQNVVQGLRGGAAVIMVAAWENFIKQLMEEELTELTTIPHKVDFVKLPDEMRIHSIFQTLERAIKGPLFQEAPPKIQRLESIESACKIVISGTVNPLAFNDIGSNPSPKTVKKMFLNVGIKNIFIDIKSDFESKWGCSVASTFIENKLEEVINRRHVVAHKADALNISRSDLKQSIKFLKVLSSLLERYLKNHIKIIIKK